MSVTVIIPTCRRAQIVSRAVRGTLEQLGAGDRCIVVVQGTERDRAETRRALALWAAGEPEPEAVQQEALRVLEQEEPGLTRARNLGLLAADTPFVAFLDDDAVPRRGWLEALTGPLREDRADLVGGRLCESPDQTTNAPDRIGSWLTWTGHTLRNYNTDRSGPSGLAPGGNMAMRRELALRAGGFEEAFTGAALYEDVEFSERMRAFSARIWYEGEAAVDHLAVRTGDWWEQEKAAWEAERARHMSAIFSRHRPRRWGLMAIAYIGAAKWKVLRGRLRISDIWRITVALIQGRRIGAVTPRPLEQKEADR
jgi:GT2 family glycosyltransferase